jgi:hypothetical protein
MKLPAENYKGIEFIRISSLPEDQRQKLEINFGKSRIIKILKESELIKDCIQFSDYSEWYSKNFKVEITSPKLALKRSLLLPSFKAKKVLG